MADISKQDIIKAVVEDLSATIEQLKRREEEAEGNGGSDEEKVALIDKLEDITERLKPLAVITNDPSQEWFSNTSN